MGKAIAAIQNQYGFTAEEGKDPRLVAIDKIANLDERIGARHEELQLLKGELAADGDGMLYGARAEAALREARELVVQEQEAKLWAYRNLESHRQEYETYKAISVSRNKSILQTAFIESKTRVYEYWDHRLQAENALLRDALASHQARLAEHESSARHGGQGQVAQGDGGAGADLPRAPRATTPDEFRVSAPQKGGGPGGGVEGAAGGAGGVQTPGAAARKRGGGGAQFVNSSMHSVRGASRVSESLTMPLQGKAVGGRQGAGEGAAGLLQRAESMDAQQGVPVWLHKAASKMTSASFDVVRRNAAVGRRVVPFMAGNSLDEPVSFSRALDLGLAEKADKGGYDVCVCVCVDIYIHKQIHIHIHIHIDIQIHIHIHIHIHLHINIHIHIHIKKDVHTYKHIHTQSAFSGTACPEQLTFVLYPECVVCLSLFFPFFPVWL